MTEEEESGILFENSLGTYGIGAKASLGSAAARGIAVSQEITVAYGGSEAARVR